MEKVDPEFTPQYQKANHYQNLSGNKYFWRSDYHVQRTPDYFFSVKTSSERTIGSETVNSENIRGYYMGDGTSLIYQTTKEYENIFPYWDWRKIPGVTAHQEEITATNLVAGRDRNQSDFVGGVTDGENGISVMDYNRRGLKAKKSWFMFDGKIVCLGSGINSSSGIPVTTSVNQSFLNGKVSMGINKEWILHDNIGYLFPEKGELILKTDTVAGAWKDVASRFSAEILKAPLFKLYFSHGTNPVEQSYCYILVPNATEKELKKMAVKPPFVIRNEKMKQEVVSESGSTAGIIFYQAGKSNVFGGLETDKPCIVMIKKQKGGLQLSVADPTQKLAEIRMILNGIHTGENVVTRDGKSFLKIALPQGGEAGKSVTVVI